MTRVRSPFDPDFRPALLGGGQLGRMLLPVALRYNMRFSVMDSDPEAPCKHLTPDFVHGDPTDYRAVQGFLKDRDLVTIEIENVNCDALAEAEENGVRVRPGSALIRLVQDKLHQKEFYASHGIPTAEFRRVDSPEALQDMADMFPAVQKLRRAGYDGRGVQVFASPKDARAHAFDQPSLLERRVDFQTEIAVIVSRNALGQISTYPAVEMMFHETANLVEFLFAPANVDARALERADSIARELAEQLRLEGLLAVEMFVTQAGEILVNEIAPRTHNSGHHTIEACFTSQFEQHLRAILNLPPGATGLRCPAVMMNILGAPQKSGPATFDARVIEDVLNEPGVYLHLYGKRETRPNRKMGHLTILRENVEEAMGLARSYRERLVAITAQERRN